MSSFAKVLFVINKPEIGGAELHTVALARGLKSRGFATKIFAITDGPEAARFEVLVPAKSEGGASLSKRAGELRKLVQQQRYDLVVGVNRRPIALALFSRLVLGRKPQVAGVLHTTKCRNTADYIRQYLHYPAFYLINRFIFISENQRLFWRERWLRPLRRQTIVNGIDINYFSIAYRKEHRQAARASLNMAPDDIVIGLCGVFRTEKNHLQFLEALAQFKSQGVPVKGLLIGDGPCRGTIQDRIDALGLGPDVVITGFQKDVRPYLAATDIGVNCSTAVETISLSALEMLAMGIPMVMSDVGGASEIVDGRCGEVFPLGSVELQCKAIAKYFDPTRLADASRAARGSAELHFDQEKMFDLYARTFSAMLKHKNSKFP